MNMMSEIILFLSRRVQNMFRRRGHDHANSGHVLFSLSIIDWINKAATGKIEQVEADYENIASDWLKVEFGLVEFGDVFVYTNFPKFWLEGKRETLFNLFHWKILEISRTSEEVVPFWCSLCFA